MSPFHGLARIYGLINVPSGTGLLCSQAGRDVAAPLGCSVKSTGAEPGHTARMCQCNIQPSVAAAVAAVDLGAVAVASISDSLWSRGTLMALA